MTRLLSNEVGTPPPATPTANAPLPKLYGIGRTPLAKPKLVSIGKVPVKPTPKPKQKLSVVSQGLANASKPTRLDLARKAGMVQETAEDLITKYGMTYNQAKTEIQRRQEEAASGGSAASAPSEAQKEETYPPNIEEVLSASEPKAAEKPLEEQVKTAVERFDEWENNIPWQEMQGFAGEGNFAGEDGPRVFAEILDDKLCVTGLCIGSEGIFPVSVVEFLDDFGDDTDRSIRETMNRSMKGIQMQAADKSIRTGLENLVIRARLLDQNAIGMIVAVREQAAKGNERAKRSLAYINEYIARHPVEGGTPQRDTQFESSVTLANGAPLTDERITQIAGMFGEDSEKEQDLFLYGVKNWSNEPLLESLSQRFGPEAEKIINAGQSVGQARAIQVVRLPRTPITPFSFDAGWELGE